MEQEPKGPEQSAEFNQAELEARPEISQSGERAHESEADRNQQVEQARHKVERHGERPVPKGEQAPKQPHSGMHRRQAYAETMRSLQSHLKGPSRTFSKVIHNPVIEKTSEALGQTVMRPSVTLGASSTALVVGALTYLVAKRYGYSLSGSELLFSLLIGGVIGLLIEGVLKLFRRRKT